MVTACSGNTLTFEPGLTAVVTSSHTVESGANFDLTVRLDGDEFSYEMGPDRFSNLKFKFFEAVEWPDLQTQTYSMEVKLDQYNKIQ